MLRPAYLFLCLALLFRPAFAQESPDELFGELFRAVQLAPVFKDSKTFPDCIPKHSTKIILEAYAAQRSKPGFDLEAFVRDNFDLPRNPSSGFQTDTTNTVAAHISDLWSVLTRQPIDRTPGSLISLPQPYVVPGGRFREIYYWDSYFTMLGLAESGRTGLIENMVRNFAYLIDSLGFIPNGNRTYYTSRSQPPFFSLMVRLLANLQSDSVLVEFLPQLEKEYNFWMDGAESLNEENLAYRRVVRVDSFTLNRYWDDRPMPRPEAYKEDVAVASSVPDTKPELLYHNLRAACESGWDFSSRWFGDAENLNTIRTTELIPVDLNSLLYHLEITLADAYTATEQREPHQQFAEKAKRRRRAIRNYCWNPRTQFYFDYNFRTQQPSEQRTLAATYPLFFRIARPREALRVALGLKRSFLAPGGLRTTLRRTGQQWDAPNGWAPLQYMAIEGLKNYGHTELADEISRRWVANTQRVYQNTGKLVEKYNVENLELEAGGGEYPVQDGFGWTNGVYLKLLDEADPK